MYNKSDILYTTKHNNGPPGRYKLKGRLNMPKSTPLSGRLDCLGWTAQAFKGERVQTVSKDIILSVSKGNAKMGGIPSISLPAVVTCRKGAPCARKCYAAKLERIRPNVKAAYQRNLDLWAHDPAAFEAQAIAAAMPHRYFRWHVSGDIVGPSYLAMMVRVANACPGTRFLCFTKRFELVNMYIKERGPLPENLQILFSAWAGLDVPNPYNLPMTHVIYRDGSTTAPASHYVCGGNCTECLCQGVGCWQLKPGEHLAFYEH